MDSFLVVGNGKASLIQCYDFSEYPLGSLPENPDDFVAACREDGLVTYNGERGLWEAVLKLTPQQAARVRAASGVEQVTALE